MSYATRHILSDQVSNCQLAHELIWDLEDRYKVALETANPNELDNIKADYNAEKAELDARFEAAYRELWADMEIMQKLMSESQNGSKLNL